MFFASKHKLIETDFFSGFTDFHSHLLPGVDDGAKSLTETLDALKYFEKLHVGKIVFTPHVMDRSGGETLFNLNTVFQSVCDVYPGGIELSLGAEYMLDSYFSNYLNREMLCLQDNLVLVETSYFSAPRDLDEMLYKLSLNKKVPVIAHPERYQYMGRHEYVRLKDCGYLFQLNLLSLAGYYGQQVQRNAFYLLEQQMYDLVGTDLHNLETFEIWIAKLKLTNKQLIPLLTLKEQITQ